MQRLVILLLLCIVSCSKLMDKPKNLLTKDQMADVMADFAIADQGFNINTNITQQESTQYILKKHKIKGQVFTESYQYYLSDDKAIEDIFDKAKLIILKKDPKLESYIKSKSQENQAEPEQKTK